MNRLAVVTGAARGFGAALSERLAAGGWDVVACVRDAGAAAGRGRVRVVRHDVRDPVGEELLAAVGERAVDVLVNNAGIGAPGRPLAETDPATILAAVDVNVAGPLRLAQALAPRLLQARDPLIVNVSSRLGSLTAQAAGVFAAHRTSYAYRISKAAQNMLTVALAQEFAGRIRCWAVHPGALTTAMGGRDAATDPVDAAERLAALLDRHDQTSPRYFSLDGPELTW
ncbi:MULTISPECIES: SDR family NAD(P)-dependent oxidoreductase [unclassified Actinoplanes]|uniref:SDR family NAD(P)-dependent oxidoreductase n=1 Tax=unclassified Actinoplanes TaxID=2626549 RepID=UPI000301471E|nr:MULTISPECIES: SDR family NAD(P)-dependent oxidoreductase [unclassified Actinoplanes]